MRIAIFADNFYPELSGIADTVLVTAEALARRGHKITFFVPKYGAREHALANTPHAEVPHHENITIKRISSFSYPTATKQGRGIVPNPLRGLFYRGKFDIVHTHSFLALGAEASWFAKWNRLPIVGTNHTVIENFLEFAPAPVRKRLPHYLISYYNKRHHVTVPSDGILAKMRREGLVAPSSMIPNVIEDRFFLSKEEKEKALTAPGHPFTFLYVGRLSAEKNIMVLIDGFAAFVKTGELHDVRLRLVGGGALRDEALAHIRRLGMDGFIVIDGPYMGESKEKLYDAYRNADIFITASLSEVQPLTVLQAMASRMPIIVPESHSLPEMVLPDRGLVFDSRNRDDLVAKLFAVYNDAALRESLAANARAHAEQFSPDAIASQWEKLYQSIISEHAERKSK